MYILRQLNKEIEFNQDFFDIINVFKNLAILEFKRLQTKRNRVEDFFKTLEEIFDSVDWSKCSESPFLKQDKSKPNAFIAITSDEGFLGELNSIVLDRALSLRVKGKDEFILLGEKGVRLLEEIGEDFIYFGGIGQEIDYTRVEKLTNYLFSQFLKGRWAKVFFIYPHFISFAQQEIKIFQLLPFQSLAPSNGYRVAKQEGITDFKEEIILEPNMDRVLDYLIKVWANSQLFEIFWDSKFSEVAARIIHLESSTQTLSQWYKELKQRYVKTLHELRDRGIREIFASSLGER